jgi:hypothetical protein
VVEVGDLITHLDRAFQEGLVVEEEILLLMGGLERLVKEIMVVSLQVNGVAGEVEVLEEWDLMG